MSKKILYKYVTWDFFYNQLKFYFKLFQYNNSNDDNNHNSNSIHLIQTEKR